jgi:hypothetical protein
VESKRREINRNEQSEKKRNIKKNTPHKKRKEKIEKR